MEGYLFDSGQPLALLLLLKQVKHTVVKGRAN
jgi:hypothetical protein